MLERLNSLLEILKNNGSNDKIQINFCKNYYDFALFCSNLVPFARVGVLCSNEFFLSVGNVFYSILKEKGLRPFNVAYSVKEVYKGKDGFLSDICLEDTRLIICDLATVKLAEYICSKKNLPLAVMIFSPTDRIICSEIQTDLAEFTFERLYGIFPTAVNCVSNNVSVSVSKIISLLDVNLKQFLKEIKKNFVVDQIFSDLTHKTVELILGGIKTPSEKVELLELRLCLEVLESFYKHTPVCTDIITALYYLKTVQTCITEKCLKVPNYVDRAQRLSKEYGYDYYLVLKGLKRQLQIISENKNGIDQIKSQISKRAQGFLTNLTGFINCYFAHGGKNQTTSREILKKIRVLSDLPSGINCLSLVRETGALE